MSAETEERFVEGVDLEQFRYYTDCECINVSGDELYICVIIYDDDMRDYINGNDPKALKYYESVKQKIGPIKTKESSYYKFGYRVMEEQLERDGNLFIETHWTKE